MDTELVTEGKRNQGQWWQVVERLLAAGGVVAAALYVMLQGLYVEFYDDFGVRPEQVGLDQTAILSHALAIALAGLVLLVIGIAAGSWFGWSSPSPRVQKALAATVLVATVLVVGGYYFLLTSVVEGEARKVTEGKSVNGIAVFGPLLVDVRAHPASVKWLGEPSVDPALPSEVMFLGRGDDVAVFYTEDCSSLVLPAADVEVQLLDQGPNPPEEDLQLGWNPEDCEKGL